MTSPNTSNHSELLTELWEAAVNLRGQIEPSDYKKYVLPLIFLRFLSLRYEERRNELQDALADPASDLYVDDPESRKQILNDKDEYLRANVFPPPSKARWDYLRRHAQSDDIKIKVDEALESVESEYPDKLRGLLPPIFAQSNLSRRNVTGLINLFSKDVFQADHGGADLLGKVYEYFIGEFADSEGKRAGQYFTPVSIVRTLVTMLAPDKGVVLDPCCGSGGMFVQSDAFSGDGHSLSFYGQESEEFTYRMCRMNLFIHGIDGDIRLGNAYWDDQHEGLKADYVLANPPFNDGSKSDHGWGADRIQPDDPRRIIGNHRMPLTNSNANTMWLLHFLHHLSDGGTAGFVMATGELSNQDNARLTVRKTLIEEGFIDCIVRLSAKLFANTQIPCSLWFLSKNRSSPDTGRKRDSKILFIDARQFGSLIPGSRTQKVLSEEEIRKIASPYRQFVTDSDPEKQEGFCAVASVDEVRENSYMLTPGRYVGLDRESLHEDVDASLSELRDQLEQQMTRSRELEDTVADILEALDAV